MVRKPAPAPAAPARLAAAPLTLSLPEQIAAQLAARITSGAYAPGQRIMEQAVAGEFAVSRGPVREALRLLEKDGLVTILARRGAQYNAGGRIRRNRIPSQQPAQFGDAQCAPAQHIGDAGAADAALFEIGFIQRTAATAISAALAGAGAGDP